MDRAPLRFALAVLLSLPALYLNPAESADAPPPVHIGMIDGVSGPFANTSDTALPSSCRLNRSQTGAQP